MRGHVRRSPDLLGVGGLHADNVTGGDACLGQGRPLATLGLAGGLTRFVESPPEHLEILRAGLSASAIE